MMLWPGGCSLTLPREKFSCWTWWFWSNPWRGSWLGQQSESAVTGPRDCRDPSWGPSGSAASSIAGAAEASGRKSGRPGLNKVSQGSAEQQPFPLIKCIVSPQFPAATETVPSCSEAVQLSGQKCWRCGQHGHILMIFHGTSPPTTSPGSGETYCSPVTY